MKPKNYHKNRIQMFKKELVWREILHRSISDKEYDFTQKNLTEKLGVSSSTVFGALKIPRVQGAIKVTGRKFSVIDKEKFLYIWATARNIEKEIIYKTVANGTPKEIEGFMPAGIIFGACSAYAQKYGDAPADYDKVYVYSDEDKLEEIKKRFPIVSGNPNLFVIGSDKDLLGFGGAVTPDVQTFCDLWNMREWYAKEFLKKIKERMNLE